ncbi:deoxyguanosinetriphosphate triphosphohydrolase [Ponticaulis sp.]|uniref:deoxyguanosinetriphosphate triphosphohydrolase n=1 Tax=Ponticaulis sp. TaxID=2020902 RepID=UPI000B6FC5BE|nr:deoxyguanosinetriphosphate triphosphohydrolase [Ponticaulis sp.]MAI92089.1 deoxyguanosinetriphosphate triphosphohydrolase [Ponticaulis sp.]OUX96263.1 MAG: deoxyguanosinetriphosphate triphosphohydrolase [Hyphomonadaceae bacterium TMED5]|tara:strand:+ start:59044 stop:60231 length:1188 start_codon:yes stop_codon:yes gene_type:complete
MTGALISPRVDYASDPAASRGRFQTEPVSPTRTPFQRDRDRIIHASAFRRLKMKTQVFVAHEGDHFRTRLTHSLEVAQIARSAARTLGLDEDLAEALALAHDLGHPPFGHAGEDELDECMAEFEGFDHNAQTLRVVTRLEQRYPTFDGLNLCWETLEGLVKHNGPLIKDGKTFNDLPLAFRDFEFLDQLELDTYAGPEAQIAALSDDIAYNNHDIDDGLSAGLFTIEDIKDVPLVGRVFHQVQKDYPLLDRPRIISEAVRRLIGIWINDLTAETSRRAKRLQPKSVEDVRHLNEPLVAFSDELHEEQKELRRFLMERMYRHYKVNRKRSQAKRILKELFALFLEEPDTLPPPWNEAAQQATRDARARIVCDYIAGMTDNFAIEEHRRLFNLDAMM